jgi:glycosyltransferase involved in cell wall biosynthesis
MDKQIKDGISIITIVLNGKSLIEETIKSVINQNFHALEYIIIDGGSTDGTLEIIEKYKTVINKIVSGQDGGIYQAINKGIALCNYAIVGIIHCGDIYAPGALSKVYTIFKESDADVIYGDIEIKEECENDFIVRNEIANHSLLKNQMSIYHPATFVKLSVYGNIGMYNCNYKIASDYDFFLNLFLKGNNFIHVPFILATFRSGGISGKNFYVLLKENYLIRKIRIGKMSAVFYLFSTIAVHSFYKFRRAFIISIIGKNNYYKIKQNKNK